MMYDLDLEERWAVVWCDFGSYGLWDASGRAYRIEDVPLSPNMRAWVLTWQGWYNAFNPPDVFGHAAHCRAGITLARAIKAKLPDWTIIATVDDTVASEMSLPPSQDRGHYRVEEGGALVPCENSRPLSKLYRPTATS